MKVLSVACFGLSVSVTFQLMFFHITFRSVWVAVWPPYGKKLFTRKKKVYPCKPQFYYIKVGCKGYKSHGHVFLMFLFLTVTNYSFVLSCQKLSC